MGATVFVNLDFWWCGCVACLLPAGCATAPSIINGQFDGCPSGLAGGPNGPTRCTGACNAPDYALSPNLGTPTAVCKDSGSWEVTGACLRGELFGSCC